MAHQAHNIPWTVLASTLKLKTANSCQHHAQNFHVRKEPDRGKKLTYFANAFVKNALDHARCERDKYPKTYDPPADDDVVISDEVAKTIEPTVYRWRLYHDAPDEFDTVQEPNKRKLCQHMKPDETCQCPLPFKERKMSAFLNPHTYNSCYEFYRHNRDGFFNLEVVKSLLLYGEMDTILRICAAEYIDLENWWEQSQCACMQPDLGWDKICRLAIDSYVLLNLIQCFPETWDNAGTPSDVYTSIKAYQYVVRHCTKSGWTSDIATYPHRQFFGIEKGQFKSYPTPHNIGRWGHLLEGKYQDMTYYPYGLMPYQEFLEFEKPMGYQPHTTDVTHVQWILCQRGLPPELADAILDEADYTPKRRLRVADQPLHPENRADLESYLKYCWQLIVRCTMMGQALGMDMELLLGNMIRLSIGDLFICKCAKIHHWTFDDKDRDLLVFK
ncbi:hypothetical protein NW754_005898 [Fusarium falciforme]|nr:hypothetical protein NW754_005898 [Fusarium falciforme]